MEAAKIEIGAVGSLQERSEWRQFVFGERPNRTLIRVIVWSLATVAFFHQLLMPIQIIGSSMNPTYESGSLNLVNRLSYTKSRPHKGDVVAVRADDELLLKRIVASPGDSIGIAHGRLMINNHPLHDQFSMERIPWEMDPTILGPNEYFVIGDNRSVSVFCKVKKNQILGKIIF